MTHVTIDGEFPGIVGLLRGFPDTGKPLRALAEALLRGPCSLTVGEREFLATYVSYRNGCRFCWMSHGAATTLHFGISEDVLMAQLAAPALVSGKIGRLAAIAEEVRANATVRPVSDALVRLAREDGADDEAIHHTVLIAAAFCMYNRYVEGLGTRSPTEFASYVRMGAELAKRGYEKA